MLRILFCLLLVGAALPRALHAQIAEYYYNTERFNTATLVHGNAEGFRLANGQTLYVSVRIGPEAACSRPDQTAECEAAASFQCRTLVNSSGRDYFFPARSALEASAFMYHAPEGVSGTNTPCEVMFREWQGLNGPGTAVAEQVNAYHTNSSDVLEKTLASYCAQNGPCQGGGSAIEMARYCQVASGAVDASCRACTDDFRLSTPERELGCAFHYVCPPRDCTAGPR